MDVLTPRSAEPPRAAWTLWYEDESLEDCGLASNVEGVDCLDRWQSTGRGFASLRKASTSSATFGTTGLRYTVRMRKSSR